MKKVKFKGEPLNLVGITFDKIAPDFRVISQELKEVNFYEFKDKIKVITSFPSLDTPVCDLQLKEFNKRAVEFSEEIVLIGISMDLPFAQKRFCELNNIKNVSVFSDYKYHSFSLNWGLLIKELGLIARGVFVIDKRNYIRYSEIVEELTQQPDYEKAIENIKEVVKNPEEKEWEKIICCKWEEKEGIFIKVFEFKDNLTLKYLFEIFSLIRQEKNIEFNMKLEKNKVVILIPSERFNVEKGSIFDSIIF